MRFSRPAQPESATAEALSLFGDRGRVFVRVVAAEAGRLVFVQPVFSYPREDFPTLAYVGVIDGDNMRRLAGLRRDGTPTSGGDLRTQVQPAPNHDLLLIAA